MVKVVVIKIISYYGGKIVNVGNLNLIPVGVVVVFVRGIKMSMCLADQDLESYLQSKRVS